VKIHQFGLKVNTTDRNTTKRKTDKQQNRESKAEKNIAP
jgi:hypothetical protein